MRLIINGETIINNLFMQHFEGFFHLERKSGHKVTMQLNLVLINF